MPKYQNLDAAGAYKKLLALAPQGKAFDFKKELNAERVKAYRVPMAGGLTYSYAAKAVNEATLQVLQELADEQELIEKYKLLLNGEVMNTGEKRKVLHHLLRGQLGAPVLHEGRDLGQFYAGELKRFSEFARKIHREASFDTVVQIGIGGSDLGPRALYLALENWADRNGKRKMKAAFISNVDPDDASQVLSQLNLKRTLFVLVSKSGITQETLANELFVKAKLRDAGLDPAKHLVAVTSETSPLAHNSDYLDSFYIDDFIGGRYSSTSAVGGVILSLTFGPETFAAILDGAHEADKSALEKDIKKNPALLDALIGLWERNALGYPSTAILPYSQALSRFPAHLQQLDMESNGKRVNRNGEPLNYATGPVVFGEPGTNGQHSFYQLLHQGTDIVPLQFIGFEESQRQDDVEVDGSTSQTKLKANLAAQIVAFAKGKDDQNKNKEFPGGRPSSLIYGKALTPQALGALLAHFENKVMFQGFAWNLNSFDQEGVQLGKVLTKQVLAGNSGDSALEAYAELLSI
ncbi:glucose-6-phosphate isomerase [Gracilinema caldarium]|uniref:glucose-6-phosphate isomerase n=1 Tax=Gracilinema caldarium TaxID=215591 RepID=UPI0026EEA068|nr:glucose-6-phosphate isomerase [Gracilinema caldarium]